MTDRACCIEGCEGSVTVGVFSVWPENQLAWYCDEHVPPDTLMQGIEPLEESS